MKLIAHLDAAVHDAHTLSIVNTNEIGRHILQRIRRFWRAFPDPITLRELEIDSAYCVAGYQALAWLVSQNIITNFDDRFVLTLTGRESLRRALSANRCLAEVLLKGECVIERHDPSKLMLMILKTHYNGFLARPAK